MILRSENWENITKPELRKSFRDSDISCQNCQLLLPSHIHPKLPAASLNDSFSFLSPATYSLHYSIMCTSYAECTYLFNKLYLLEFLERHCASFPQKLLVSRDACQQLWSAGISHGQQTVTDTIWTQLDWMWTTHALLCICESSHKYLDQSRVVIVFCWHDNQRTPCDHLVTTCPHYPGSPGAGDNGSVLQDTVTILSSRKVINNDLVLS